jgi:hypothetical protein
VEEAAAGSSAAQGDTPRELVEATSGGNLDQAVAGLPDGARETAVNAAREGFLSGFNEIMVLGGIIAFAGAIVAVWLVREHEIERDQPEAEIVSIEPEAAPEAIAA